MKKHKISYVSLFLCSALLLTSCSESGSILGTRSMEPVAVLDYELPSSVPGFMADIRGYSVSSEKYAYLRLLEEAGAPDYFSVRDLNSGRIVYEGMFEKSKMGDELLKADFSDLKTEGIYRAECSIYGCTEEFRISGDMYEALSHTYEERITEGCRDLSASPETVLDYLQAYEWYGRDEDEGASDSIVSSAPESLTIVRDWISGKDYQGSRDRDAALYAAILAKFSFLYKEYDSSLATECLQKASSIYSQSGNVIKSDADSFRALTELYRASGESSYYNEISEYKESFLEGTGALEDGYMFGTMTYIVTRQAVDKELCDLLVGRILSDAQDINGNRREITDPVSSALSSDAEMLRNIRKLMCANYILRGYEYNMTIQQMFHYLSGLNVESAVFEPGTDSSGMYYFLCDYLSELEKEGKL